MSNRAIITIALAPIGAYVALVCGIFVLNPAHFPGSSLAVAGSVIAILSVGFANVLRLRRDRRA